MKSVYVKFDFIIHRLNRRAERLEYIHRSYRYDMAFGLYQHDKMEALTLFPFFYIMDFFEWFGYSFWRTPT